jgi:hypothetical protein
MGIYNFIEFMRFFSRGWAPLKFKQDSKWNCF